MRATYAEFALLGFHLPHVLNQVLQYPNRHRHLLSQSFR